MRDTNASLLTFRIPHKELESECELELECECSSNTELRDRRAF